jgi:hypothetical protein
MAGAFSLVVVGIAVGMIQFRICFPMTRTNPVRFRQVAVSLSAGAQSWKMSSPRRPNPEA